jgi:hypothetical protein
MMGSGVPSEDVVPWFAVMQERLRAAAVEKSAGARLGVAM